MLALVSDTGKHRRLALSGCVLSHPGMVRTINEDSVAYFLPGAADPASRHGCLALVADGMGGHAAGEVASQIAAEMIGRLYYQLDGSVPDVLAKSFAAANAAIWSRGQADPDCAGMGTTCTAIAVRDNRAFLAHIGDSRAYFLRGADLRQISHDDSLVANLLRDGRITREEAQRSPQRNVILRALGTKPRAEPAICPTGIALRPGDVLVLCSDGLSDLVDDGMIGEIVSAQPPDQACRTLVDAALAAGGHDNVSVGVFRVGPPDPPNQDDRHQAQGDAT
jgi:serine/threonine protein phosphatase PrpC